VTPPDCPDWTRSGAADFTTQAATNFGCATTTNLGLMVADPGDLVRGRPAPSADGEAATLGVQRYRTGKTLKLLDSDTQGGGTSQ
jgi:pilus assembly protein CpaD